MKASEPAINLNMHVYIIILTFIHFKPAIKHPRYWLATVCKEDKNNIFSQVTQYMLD